MKAKQLIAKSITLIALLILTIISLQLIRILLLYSGNSTKIIGYYMFCILSAALFIWLSVKYQLKVKYILIGLAILTFLYQFIYGMTTYLTYEGDLRFYFDNAVKFTRYGFETSTFYQAVFPTTITYPAFLTPFMKIFGAYRMVPIVLNQITMTGLSCLIFLFLRKKMSLTFSLAGAFLLCLHPFTIIYSNTSNAELIFGALMLAAFVVSKKAKDVSFFNKKVILIALSAALCGFANMFRPLGIIMIIAILMDMLLLTEGKFRMNLLLSTVLLLAYFLTQTGSGILQKQIGGYASASNGFGWNLYVGASATGKWNPEDAAEFSQVLNQSDSPSDVHAYFLEKGIDRYRKMGVNIIPHFMRKLSPWYSSEYMANEAVMQDEHSPFDTSGERQTYLTLISIVDFPIFLFSLFVSIWFLISALKRKSHEGLTLILYLLGSFFVLMVLEIAPRYTVSYRQIFCVITVYGIHALSQSNFFRKKIAL